MSKKLKNSGLASVTFPFKCIYAFKTSSLAHGKTLFMVPHLRGLVKFQLEQNVRVHLCPLCKGAMVLFSDLCCLLICLGWQDKELAWNPKAISMFFLVNEKNVSSALKLGISAKLGLRVSWGAGYRAHLSQESITMEFASSIYCQSMNLLTFRLCCLFYNIFSGEEKWEDWRQVSWKTIFFFFNF